MEMCFFDLQVTHVVQLSSFVKGRWLKQVRTCLILA